MIMQSIFKRIKKEVISINKKLENSYGEENIILNQKKDLLDEIVKYVSSFNWLYKEPLKEKVKFFINSDYDYESLCRTFNVSYDSARSSMKWAATQLEKKIGSSTLQLIKEGRIADARATFYMGIGKIKKEDYILKSFLCELPQEKFTAVFDLKDCQNELIILRNLSTERFNKYLEILNDRKMAFCLHLIEGTSKKADDYRIYMINYLTGKISLDALLSIEDEMKKIKFIVRR